MHGRRAGLRAIGFGLLLAAPAAAGCGAGATARGDVRGAPELEATHYGGSRLAAIPRGRTLGLTGTERWQVVDFWNRVRRGVAREWLGIAEDIRGGLALRRNRPIAGLRSFATAVYVRVNRRGEVASIAVRQSSGFPGFDRAAPAAITRARPFPPPPASVLDADGHAHFDLGFVLHRSGRSASGYF